MDSFRASAEAPGVPNRLDAVSLTMAVARALPPSPTRRARPTRAWPCLLLLLAGCPERRYPERGTALVFRAEDGVGDAREAVERRLAWAKLKVRLSTDGDSLEVRVPEGGDVARVKALLQTPAKLELCEELAEAAVALCDRAPDAGVTLRREGEAGCALAGSDAAAVRAQAQAAGPGRVVLEEAEAEGPPRYESHYAAPGCLLPRIVDAQPVPVEGGGPRVLAVSFDDASATAFEALTRRLVRRRLLIVLDGAVLLAPVVMQPLHGGKAQLTGRWSEADAALLAAQLVGGPVPVLRLEAERAYGPPRL